MACEKAKNKKVVVAMDGSKHAEFALRYYKENCHKDGDEVTVLFVTDFGHMFTQPMFSVDPQMVSHMVEEGQKEMVLIVERIKEFTKQSGLDARVIKISTDNNPGEAIVHWAKENHVSLLVMGTRGQGKLRRTLLGSVSQYVVHHAHVPVLICPHK